MIREKLKQRFEKIYDQWAQMPAIQQEIYKILAIIVLLGGVGFGFWLVGKPFWRGWKQQSAIKQAQHFAEVKDYRNAVLALRRATEQNVSDLETWKIVGDFLSEIGSSEVLTARKNAVNLAPDDNSLRLAYVVEALRYGEIPSAKEALDAVRDGANKDLAFHRMAAAVSMALRQTKDLVGHLERILQFDPKNAEARFNLSALRVWSDESDKAEFALQDLRELTAPDNPMRVRAALELMKFTARVGGRVEVDALVSFLHTQFCGRLPAKSQVVNSAGQPPGWFALLEALKVAAAKDAFDAAQLGRWMASISMRSEALLWLEELPLAMRRGPIVGSVLIDLIVSINDLERLRRVLVEGGALGKIDSAVVDLAYAARWQRMHRLEARGRTTWDDAIGASASSLNALRALLRLADAWGDGDGAEVVLRRIVQDHPGERWAIEALRLSYARRRDTEKLYHLYALWAGRSPENHTVLRTWVMLSFLLNRVSPEVFATAGREYAAAPEDIVVVLCRAAALRAKAQPEDALAVLDALPVSDWQRPKVALWRGVLLADTGNKDRARTALQVAITDPNLLPEESALITAAGNKIGIRITAPK